MPAVQRRQGEVADRRALPRGGRRADDPAALWLSVSAYARVYSITRNTVYKWMDAGLLESLRVDAVVRIKNRPPQSV